MYSVKEVVYSEWETHLKEIQHFNILQHWLYGEAKEQTSKWKAVRFLITRDGQFVALAQLLVITLPFLGGIARMNRGPLLNKLIENDYRDSTVCNVIKTLVKEAKKRYWWVIQIAPELANSLGTVQVLRTFGLRQLNAPPYASGLIDLLPNKDHLLMSLKGKWRNCLRKGILLGTKVTKVCGNSSELNILIKSYSRLKQDKGFLGVPDSLIISLAKQEGEGWEFTLFIANEENFENAENPAGMLVSIRHGDTTTYFIGYTNEKGRKLKVNYILLWEAILHAKQNGCKWFDIGGLNSSTPKGIAHFKSGLNPEYYGLIGEFRGFIVPWKR